jgi:hypothetical protein
MPLLKEARLPCHIHQLDAAANAVQAVVGEGPAIGAAREVGGESIVLQPLRTPLDRAGPVAEMVEPGSLGRIPRTPSRPLDQLYERWSAASESDAIVPLTKPISYRSTPVGSHGPFKVLHSFFDVRHDEAHMVEGSHQLMIQQTLKPCLLVS